MFPMDAEPPRGAVLISIRFDPAGDGDWGDEAVASPGNIDDEPIPVLAVTQRASQSRHMDREVGGLD